MLVPGRGFEPRTRGFTVRCSGQLSYPGRGRQHSGYYSPPPHSTACAHEGPFGAQPFDALPRDTGAGATPVRVATAAVRRPAYAGGVTGGATTPACASSA